MFSSRCALAAAVFACSSFGISVAQTDTSSAIAGFRAIDTDRDAKLDRRELAAAARLDFKHLDLHKNGFLTAAELANARSDKLLLPFPGRFSTATAFAAVDTDHDRKISEQEYETAVVRAYLACDANHDGTIELSDLRRCSK